MSAFASILSLTAPALVAQSFQGGVRGRIHDQSGAAIPTAKVTLTAQATNVSRSTLSNDAGEYSFPAVNPEAYSITVESPGFKFASRQVTVQTQTFLTVDVAMELGNVTETVNVTEEVPLMETANASTGQVVDRQKLVDLPNLGRNPFMMSKIAQNVVPAGNPIYNRMQDQSGSSQISIAGGPVRGNNYLLDGIPITDSVNRAVIIPTIESVQEVKIQANTYDAEMGRTGGGVFNTYLKSGTNHLHGSGFGYIRETTWAANSFFNNRGDLPRAEQPFRNYGGSLGGPIILPRLYDGRNQTFFWIGAEAYRQTSALGSEYSVPTLAERAGDFSSSASRAGGAQIIYDPLTTLTTGGQFSRTPFPGNRIPTSRIDTVGRNIAATYPTPSRAADFLGANNYSASASLYDRADQASFKADHELAPWWRASVSYLHYGSREPGENWFGGTTGPSSWLLARKVDATQVNNVLTLNPTTVVNIRYGFNRFPNASTQRSMGYDLAALGFAPAFTSAVQSPTFPNVTMETFASLGTNSNSFTVYHSKNLLGSVSKFIGRHNLKAGADFRRINIDGVNYGNNSGAFTFRDVFTRATPVSATAGTGSDLATMLLGYPVAGDGIVASNLFQHIDYYAAYFHDDFRLSSRLTLNLGLRYEYETGLQGNENALVTGFDRTAVNPLPTVGGAPQPNGALMYAGLNGAPTQTGNNNRNKLSPRVGAAYSLDSKTTIRGGYGLFWAPIPYGLQSTLGYAQTTPVLASVDGNATPASSLSNPFPNGLLPIVGNSLGQLAGIGQTVSFIDQFHRSPRVHQYSFDIQREVKGLTLLAGYVGTTSRNMVLGTGTININQLDPSNFSIGRPLLDRVPNLYYSAGGPGLIGATSITRAQSLMPFPQFDRVNLTFSDQNKGRYDSLVLKAQKRMAHGISFVTTWTWSKNMDASFGGPGNNLNTAGALQNSYDPFGEYGLAVVDATHRWASAFTYELPFGRGRALLSSSRLLDAVVGGWSVNAVSIYQSGFPLAITQQSNNNSALGAGQRPNATGVSPSVTGSFAQRLDGWINPAAFSQAPAFAFGNLSRSTSLRGPGQASWDMSVFKTFTLMEGVKAQFRAEALNAFNTPQFRSPNTTFGNANFGRVTSQANFPRLIQLGVRFFL
ncbi:MAG: TonB-dependent receptor [Bryobacteraceae bacterium]